MTLNITVLAEDVVYQSADFRLWNPVADELETDTSTKMVSVRGWGWQSTLTYTGIGRFRRDTAQYVVQWLAGQAELSFEDTVELVRMNGSRWLRQVSRANGIAYPHTFVIATFRDGVATAAVVSNFESVGQPRSEEISHDLRTSFVWYRTRPVVLVTGCVTPVVSRRQRRMLERLAEDHGDDPARIRRAMQELNRQAARIGGSNTMVSEECVVQSFDRAGRGQHSGLVAGAQLRQLVSGVDVGTIVEDVARQFFPRGFQVRSATSATSAGHSAVGHVCSPELSAMSTSEDYELVELAPATGLSAVAHGVNRAGLVVGSSNRTLAGPALPAYWSIDGDTMFFEDLGGISGQAHAVNDSGIVVGAVEDEARRSHACLWASDSRLRRLSVDGATHSGARSINDAGDVVGWVSFHPTEGGQEHHRPAVWPQDDVVQVAHDLPVGWGEAIAINSRRQVLMWGHEGMRAVPLLWHDGQIASLVQANQYLVPVGLDAEGRVLGWTRNAAGRAQALIWTVETGWMSLGTEPDWYVTAMSDDGVIVGYADLDGFRRPWVLNPESSQPQLLPHYAYHFNEAHSISSSHTLCGSSQSDHGCHALVWRHKS